MSFNILFRTFVTSVSKHNCYQYIRYETYYTRLLTIYRRIMHSIRLRIDSVIYVFFKPGHIQLIYLFCFFKRSVIKYVTGTFKYFNYLQVFFDKDKYKK